MEFRTYNFEKLIDKKAESKFKGIGLLTNQYLKEGNYPIVDQGKSLTNGYTNDNSKVILVEMPIIIFGDHTRIFKFIDFDFAPGADGTKVIVPNYKLINPKLFYLLLKNSKIPNDGYGRHYKHLKELEFEIPSDFKKQEELANVLSNKLSSLEQMRQAALKQKEAVDALQGALLREVFPYKDGDELPKGWKWEKIGKLIDKKIKTFARTEQGEFTYIDISSIDNYQKKIVEPKHIEIKNAPSRAKYILQNGDIILSNVRPNLNAVALIDENNNGSIGSSGFTVIRPLENYYNNFLFLFFTSPYFIDYVTELVQGAMYPAMNEKDVWNCSIPIPDFKKQKEISNSISEQLQKIYKLKQQTETQIEAIEALPAAILREVFEFNKN